MPKPKEFNIERTIRGAIRRVFSRSPVVREVLMAVRREVPKFNADGQRSKKDSVQYKCGACGTWTKSTAVSVDHIHPVVCVDEGFIDYNTFVERLFCPKENLQAICDTCHDAKSLHERLERLTKRYTRELDDVERAVTLAESVGLFVPEHKILLKELARFVAKKKTDELKPIADRAAGLKERVKNIKPTK